MGQFWQSARDRARVICSFLGKFEPVSRRRGQRSAIAAPEIAEWRNYSENRRLVPLLSLLPLSVSLSGCIAAAIPLATALSLGTAAFTGFEAYKAVQTVSGGTVTVEFPSADGKIAATPPMPAAHRIAVWPGDEIEVVFAQKLENSGRYAVDAPASVSASMTDLKVPADLNQMTESERDRSFAAVCQRMHVDFVFAARAGDVEAHDNSLSFSHSNVTTKFDLLGYSCSSRQVAWQDQMVLVADVGSHQATRSELADAAGGAWADRVLGAVALAKSGS